MLVIRISLVCVSGRERRTAAGAGDAAASSNVCCWDLRYVGMLVNNIADDRGRSDETLIATPTTESSVWPMRSVAPQRMVARTCLQDLCRE